MTWKGMRRRRQEGPGLCALHLRMSQHWLGLPKTGAARSCPVAQVQRRSAPLAAEQNLPQSSLTPPPACPLPPIHSPFPGGTKTQRGKRPCWSRSLPVSRWPARCSPPDPQLLPWASGSRGLSEHVLGGDYRAGGDPARSRAWLRVTADARGQGDSHVTLHTPVFPPSSLLFATFTCGGP